MKIWTILKGFWTHTKNKLVENQMHHESGMLSAALVQVASNGFTSVLVSNTQCVLAGMPTHCEPQGFYCVCKVFYPQGSISVSLWEVTILSHSHSPAHKCKLTYFWIILSWNVWFWKLTFWLLTWVILKKIQWIYRSSEVSEMTLHTLLTVWIMYLCTTEFSALMIINQNINQLSHYRWSITYTIKYLTKIKLSM